MKALQYHIFTGFVLLIISSRAYAQQAIGYVLESIGNWSVTGSSRPIIQGSPVPSGGLLRNPSPADRSQIVIANLNGAVIKRIRCQNRVCNECSASGACYDPIRPLPQTPPQADVLTTTFQAAMELFFGKPERFSPHRVRSLRGDTNDAVLPIVDGRVDISPVFAEQKKGLYYISFHSLALKSGKPWESDPVEFSWNPKIHAASVFVPGLGPGLYTVQLLDKRGPRYRSLEIDAWVLLSEPADHKRLAFLFEQANSAAARWGSDVLPDTARGYLRAILEAEIDRPLAKDQ